MLDLLVEVYGLIMMKDWKKISQFRYTQKKSGANVFDCSILCLESQNAAATIKLHFTQDIYKINQNENIIVLNQNEFYGRFL